VLQQQDNIGINGFVLPGGDKTPLEIPSLPVIHGRDINAEASFF